MSRVLRRAILCVAVVAFVLCCDHVLISADKSGRREGDISAPVAYKDLMLVVTTSEGAAAVIFPEETDTGVHYRFRYQSIDGKNQTSGAGHVFEIYKDGVFDGGELFITAGSIKFGWSHGERGRGWIYYNPEKVRVHLAHADNFEGGKVGFGGHVTDKLDLKRFIW